MRERRGYWVAVVPMLAVLAAAPVWATSVRLVNLAEMTEAANRVFRGRCLSVEKVKETPAGLPAVEFRFVVLDAVKGVQRGETVVFRQVQTSRGRTPGIPGVPSYGKGDEVILFLAGDSRIGLTSPIGLGQGVFRLLRESDGESMAVNEVGNRNLALGMESRQAASSGLTAGDLGTLRRGGPIATETLMSLTRKIDGHRTQIGRQQ